MTTLGRSLVLAPALLLAACVTVPSGPTVMVLPGTGKSFEAFQADNYTCQQYAQATIGAGNPQQAANNAAAANAVVGSLLGAAAGAAIGAATGQAGQGAAIGAGTGLIFGTAASGPAYGYSYGQTQAMYDQAYVQCMYAKGNQVPVRAGYRYGPPPGSAPPGSSPPVYSAPPAG
ncbi:MAG TPA: glycine zipper family protein [Casimicrobiaceae bacterium]|nr:glycine zipper family protein [Casimicrobiaceae bacterium]